VNQRAFLSGYIAKTANDLNPTSYAHAVGAATKSFMASGGKGTTGKMGHKIPTSKHRPRNQSIDSALEAEDMGHPVSPDAATSMEQFKTQKQS